MVNYEIFCPSVTFINAVSSARAVQHRFIYLNTPSQGSAALIYIFKYSQPGQEDRIFNPSKGSAREEDIAIAMSWFSYIHMCPIEMFITIR